MTCIVVNAVSVSEGGSLVVLRELLSGMTAFRPDWQWKVVVNSKVMALPDVPNVESICFPATDRSGIKVRLWYENGLPGLLKRVGADVLFSQTNYVPMRRLPCPSLLLVQHAGHFSPLFSKLTLERSGALGRAAWKLKRRWVRSSVRAATLVTVQTEALARRIVSATGCAPQHIRVVAHGTGQATIQQTAAVPPVADEPLRVGYVTKSGVQKNFPVLFEAAARLVERGVRLTLVLTLSTEIAANREVLGIARRLGLEGIIENHGELGPQEIGGVYRSLHVFVFPSLCESFGFPMVEAMAYGIPLLIADVDSNVEIAGECGIAFVANDSVALAGAIDRLAQDRAWHESRARASLARAREFSWTGAAARTVELLEELIQVKVVQDHGPDSSCAT